jgi:hypothetical protein
VHLIRFRFLLDRAPPGCPPESLLCPSCDPLWSSIGHTPLTVAAGHTQPRRTVASGAMAAAGGSAVPLYGAPAATAVGGMPSPAGQGSTGAGLGESDYQAALAGKRVRKTVQSTLHIAPGGQVRSHAPATTGAAGRAGPGLPDSTAGGLGAAGPERVIEQVMCGCGVPCKLLIVNKDGPNKGRPFYACAKPRYAT